VGAALALKYKSGDSADLSQETPENADEGSPPVENAVLPEPQPAAPLGDGSGPDAKLGSRWRLALRDRPVASEVE
jgi:hypothetical protein